MLQKPFFINQKRDKRNILFCKVCVNFNLVLYGDFLGLIGAVWTKPLILQCLRESHFGALWGRPLFF
jgi:hypothetical protein